jgi:hypothetical protein
LFFRLWTITIYLFTQNRFSYEKNYCVLSFFLSFFPSPLNAQGDVSVSHGDDGDPNLELSTSSCGFSISDAEYLSFLQSISFDLTGSNPVPTTVVDYQIPIHLTYVVHDDGGFFSDNYNFDDAIELTNETFALAGISFYICDVTILPSTDYTVWNSLEGDLDGLYNLHHVDDAINVYQVESITHPVAFGIQGLAYPPNSSYNKILIRSDNNIPGVLTHELGHYLGLAHTFRGGQPEQFVNYPAWFQGEWKFASEIGDFLDDTAGDPGDCTGGCTGSSCPDLDPAGDIYAPEFENAMNNTYCDETELSAKQLAITYSTLTTHPNRIFLTTTEPECDYIAIPTKGKVEYYDCNPVPTPFRARIDYENITESLSGTVSGAAVDGTYFLEQCGIFLQMDHDFIITPKREYSQWEHMQYNRDDEVVTSLDLTAFQDHIFGVELLDSPYKVIAGDVNGSGWLTVSDLSGIQNLILNQVEFPVGSYRYVPKYYLESDADFNNDFFDDYDPFSAVWTHPTSNVTLGYPDYMDKLNINLLNPDVANTSTWGFIALKVGDADCTVDTNPNFQNTVVEDRSSEYSYDELHNCPKEGETIDVTIELKSNDFRAYQLGLKLDTELVDFLEIVRADIPSSSKDFGLGNIEEGKIKTLWYSPTGEKVNVRNDGTSTLFKLRLKVLKEFCKLSDVIQLDHQVLKSQVISSIGNSSYDYQIVFGIDEVHGDDKLVNQKFDLFPNPFLNEIFLKLNLEKDTQVEFIFSDVYGHVINYTKQLQKGEQSHTLEMNSLNDGIIFYNIIVDGKIYNGKLIKIAQDK